MDRRSAVFFRDSPVRITDAPSSTSPMWNGRSMLEGHPCAPTIKSADDDIRITEKPIRWGTVFFILRFLEGRSISTPHTYLKRINIKIY
ncbi:hypothetical protein [Methanothermobacter sp. K4]|uniref:hypothetical protein n=1 Tax=Methanothermobacter sp. K4 TaxID=2913262 RepID=UPI001EDA4D4E|nr:hypothetical protein [Methanothermobacter sp. K4]MCG2829190.1 hypothetical protein [Methanothermobacter sp. K4]